MIVRAVALDRLGSAGFGPGRLYCGTFAKFGQVTPRWGRTSFGELIVQAAAELRSVATTKNGMRFDNYYYWVVIFAHEMIGGVRV